MNLLYNLKCTFYNSEIRDLDYGIKDSGLKLKRALNEYEKIHYHLNDETVKALALDHMLHTLEELNKHCEAVKYSISSVATAFMHGKKIPPNSKLTKQKVNFTQTSRKKRTCAVSSLCLSQTEQKNTATAFYL